VVYKPTTPDVLYKKSLAPNIPGSPDSACPLPFRSATTLPAIEPKQAEPAEADSGVPLTLAVAPGVIKAGEMVSLAVSVNVALMVSVGSTVGERNAPGVVWRYRSKVASRRMSPRRQGFRQ
jgi:hypothetical protein